MTERKQTKRDKNSEETRTFKKKKKGDIDSTNRKGKDRRSKKKGRKKERSRLRQLGRYLSFDVVQLN